MFVWKDEWSAWKRETKGLVTFRLSGPWTPASGRAHWERTRLLPLSYIPSTLEERAIDEKGDNLLIIKVTQEIRSMVP